MSTVSLFKHMKAEQEEKRRHAYRHTHLKEDIAEASLEFWISWNYEVAQGRKDGEEWLDEEEEEVDNFIKWSQESFVDRDTCYFCGVGAGNCWVVGGEDAVCCGCEEKWRYDENKDGYIKK